MRPVSSSLFFEQKMPILSKIWKVYLETSQFGLGLFGGFIYYLMRLLSLGFKPLKKLLDTYKNGAPIYSTFLLTLISTAIFILGLNLLSIVLLQIGFFPKDRVVYKEVIFVMVLTFFVISPWFFLALDLFAFYKRFRSDRKK